MDIEDKPFGTLHLLGEPATHPLARPGGRPALLLLLAGPGMQRRRVAPATRPDAPSGAFNCRF
jgi:hypothetical protein